MDSDGSLGLLVGKRTSEKIYLRAVLKWRQHGALDYGLDSNPAPVVNFRPVFGTIIWANYQDLLFDLMIPY